MASIRSKTAVKKSGSGKKEAISSSGHVPKPPGAPKSLVEGFEPTRVLEQPKDCFSSIITKSEQLDLIAAQFGIPRGDLRLPEADDRAYSPPEGYMAWSKMHCWCGAVPPLNTWLSSFAVYLKICPFQLHPNAYAILAACTLSSNGGIRGPRRTGRFAIFTMQGDIQEGVRTSV